MKKNYFIILVLFISYFITGVFIANASQLYFEPNAGQFGKNDQFEIKLFIDTEGENINAIEGEIIYPSELLRLIDINDSNSIINFWIEKPKLKNDGKIFLSGIIPGGFDGLLTPYDNKKHSGEILTVVFESLKKSSSVVTMQNVQALINDGEGTPDNVFVKQFSFNVQDYIGNKKIITQKDTIPPEEFKVEISQDDDSFNGKYFLIFNTQDKESGIYYYKVREGDDDFEIVESPYVLKNQKLTDDIIVRAIDKAGNVREEKLLAINQVSSDRQDNSIIWFFVILTSVIIILVWIKRKKY